MNANGKRVLVVDDEANYVLGIKAILQSLGYTIFTASDGQAAIEVTIAENPHLILLDVRMPVLDGLETCRRIREFSMVPIIMLTALAETSDKLQGFESGADDYVTKPFSAAELVARVKSVLRRSEITDLTPLPPSVEIGDLRVDLHLRRVTIGEKEIALTATEYRLLAELARHAGQVLSADRLLDAVWGPEYDGDAQLVWRAMHRLRQKIDPDPQSPRYIETRPGNGYLFLPG